jgi:hypothetical protein
MEKLSTTPSDSRWAGNDCESLTSGLVREENRIVIESADALILCAERWPKALLLDAET